MQRVGDLWRRVWFPEGPAHGLGVFRALYGLYWLVPWLMWAPHVELFFSSEGLHFPKYPAPAGRIGNVYDLIGWVTQPVSPSIAWGLYIGTGLLIVLTTVGLLTRAALILLFLLFCYYYYLYLHMYGTSFHRLLLLTHLCLLFSPCGKAVSIDSWLARRRGRPFGGTWPLWSQRVICFHIVILYFATGVHKVVSPAWNNGDNIKMALQGEYGSPVGLWVLARPFATDGFFDFVNLAVILFELAMPVMLCHPRLRPAAFVLGTAFHVSNGILLNIWQFLIVVFSYVLFVHPRSVERRVRALKP